MNIQVLFRLFSNASLTRAVMLAVITTCMLTGCAGTNLPATPYQSANKVGAEGYSSHRLSEGKYKIMYKGNSATSKDLLAEYSQRRAEEIAASKQYTWYRVVASESVDLTTLENQQVITAAPATPTVDGAITGEINTTQLPANQQCTASGCETINNPKPLSGETGDDDYRYYSMTVEMGRYSPRPEDAVLLK